MTIKCISSSGIFAHVSSLNWERLIISGLVSVEKASGSVYTTTTTAAASASALLY